MADSGLIEVRSLNLWLACGEIPMTQAEQLAEHYPEATRPSDGDLALVSRVLGGDSAAAHDLLALVNAHAEASPAVAGLLWTLTAVAIYDQRDPLTPNDLSDLLVNAALRSVPLG